MHNKNLPLREKDDTLLKEIYATMTREGRDILTNKYNVDLGALKGKTEAYHFQFYKSKLFNKSQRDKLDGLLKSRGRTSGIRIVEQLPTESTTKPETAKIIFECFAEAKGISQPECLLEFLELCDKENFPLIAFENDEFGLKDTIEDLNEYIAESKNEANTGTIKTATKNRYIIERVKGEMNWLDPYNYNELPFVGREKERNLLDKFANHPDQFKIWAIAGPSGAGKTRLVCQWAYSSRVLADWNCRVLHKEDRAEPEKWANWSPDRPTLIIIDYLYGFEAVVLKLMSHRLKPTAPKIRLLLIDHVFSEPLHSDKRWGFSEDGSSLNRNEKYFFDLKPLDLRRTQDQKEIIKSIIAHRAGILDEKSNKVEVAHEYLSNTQNAYHPLFAALVGDAIKSKKDFRVWNRRELIYYYLSGVRLPWKHESDSGLWASYFIAAATARRGMSYRDLIGATKNYASAPEHFGDVKKICQKVVADNNKTTLAPYEPDILGESFFLEFLKYLEDFPNYLTEFRQVFMTENEDTQTEDAIAFIAFIQRLTRNLLNDDQKQSETIALWQTLFDFMRPSDFKNSESFKWALTAGIIDIVDAIIGKFPEEELITLLNRIDPAVFYRIRDSTLLSESVFYSMRCFELTSKLTKAIPEFSEEMFVLFDRYTESITDGETPFMLASFYGYSEIMNVLIDCGVDTETTLIDGQTALMNASLGGQAEVAKQLLDARANVHATDNEGRTALVVASLGGHVDVAKLLLDEGAGIHVASNEGYTPLIWASCNGHVEVVKLLLDKRADIRASDNEGFTALHLASLNGHVDVAKLLLDEGANIHAADNNGRTALLWASFKGQVEVAKMLLDEGAKIHAANNNGHTALIAASHEGHVNVAKLLLDEGANIHAADNNGRTAILWASYNGHVEVVKMLLDEGAKIHAANNNGHTALIAASHGGHVNVAKLLLDEGANIHAVNSIGITALLWASAEGYVDVVELLLDEGANIRAADNKGRTALIFASTGKRIEVVKLLLKRKAQIDAVDNNGQTALSVATAKGHEEIIKLLVEHDKGI